MKTKFRSILCAALIVCLALGFSGCGMLKTIRDNARIASERAILDTPAPEALPGLFNDALENAVDSGVKVEETVTLSIGRPRVEPAEETDAAAVFSKTANALKDLIVMESPGSSARELANGELGDTLLAPVNAAQVKLAEAARTEAKSPVLDADGEPVTDAEGNQTYESVISNNYATVKLSFHETETSVETDENGEEKETVTVIPADAAVVNSVFGAAAEREAVLAEFSKLAAYLRVNDYETVYNECTVTALIDMDENLSHSVNYVKNFTVTASVTGVGAFADMGDMTVTFDGKWEADYVFEFDPEA